MTNAWRLAIGTLTALRIGSPSHVDRAVTGRAMVIAPLAVAPLGLLAGVVAWGGRELDLAALAVAFVVVATLALGSRALHLDGLSDVADGLTSSYDAERSLAVMKGGTAGPAGAAALVLVLGVQVASIASILQASRGPVVIAVLVCASRAILSVTCRVGVPAARKDGLAVDYAGTVSSPLTVAVWVLTAAVTSGVLAWADWPWWHGLVVAGAGLLAGAALTYRCVQRFGGVTGDVFGAAIEVALAAMLLAAT
ncbi:MAG: Adenosylcobinamide-GDP ribazoletransferase [Aeromicrobium sp.]|nr:Adenosylcobinamide-GDP ribazoletransferase [Aeromicrobium sp.]